MNQTKDQMIIEADKIDEINRLMHLNDSKMKVLKQVQDIIDQHPLYITDILKMVGDNLVVYRDRCSKQNNLLLREALGDAVGLLAMKRRPSASFITKMSIRIKKAIFKDGISSYHHQAEREFYNKYLK